MNQREYYFDNAKFILIVFVVFGHMLRPFIEGSESVYMLYKVIYTFHMPAFILVSGYFAKGIHKKEYIIKITKKLILPYIFFQLIYSVFYYFLGETKAIEMNLLNPQWALWFLISLFCWNVMLLLFSKFPTVISLLLSFAIGLAVGYVEWISNFLSLSRTFVFFPFFLLGYYLNKDHIYSLFNIRFRAFALMAFFTVMTGFYLFPGMDYEWLFGSKPYQVLGEASLTALLIRIGIYGLSLIMVFSFLAFVPRQQYFFTDLGKYTLYVYLLHGFFVRTFRASDMKDYVKEPEQFLFLGMISILLTVILSSKIVMTIAQPLIEVKMSNLRKLMFDINTAIKFYRKKEKI